MWEYESWVWTTGLQKEIVVQFTHLTLLSFVEQLLWNIQSNVFSLIRVNEDKMHQSYHKSGTYMVHYILNILLK